MNLIYFYNDSLRYAEELLFSRPSSMFLYH